MALIVIVIVVVVVVVVVGLVVRSQIAEKPVLPRDATQSSVLPWKSSVCPSVCL